jgi:Zn-dependent peptidase ImmA (M78 family)
MSQLSKTLRGLGLGADQIALNTRLPLERVQAILRGEDALLAEVRAISTGLRVPLKILATGRRPGDEGSELGLLFRGTRQERPEFDVTVERVATFVEAALRVLPQRDTISSWLTNFAPGEETYEEAGRLALLFRSLFYTQSLDDPVDNLPEVLNRSGGVVLGKLRFSQYEGVSLIAGNYCFIFVSGRFAGRMLFTLAHELGHVIAHHQKGQTPIFERASSIGNFRRASRSEGFVDAFASNLLLPDRGIARAIQTIRDHYKITSSEIGDVEILLVARYFGVSFDVAARRCEELELLPVGGAYSLSEKLKKDFGSAEKRADALGVPSRRPFDFPSVSPNLAAAIATSINCGDVSIGWAADQFGLSLGEILAANTPKDGL